MATKNTTATTPVKKVTAKDMVELLKSHYLPDNVPAGGLLAVEIGSPDGKRFADAIWQSMTRSGGLKLVGHEIKVSRADVIVELTDLSKAEPWMQYCDQWWLTVSDPSLVAGLDIPDAWGVMAPPSGRRKRSMTIIKEAPMLKPLSKDPGLLRLLTWQTYQSKKHIDTLETVNGNLQRYNDQLKDSLKNKANLSPKTPVERVIGEIYESLLDKVTKLNKLGSYHYVDGVDVDNIVESLLDMKKLREVNVSTVRNAQGVLRDIKLLESRFDEARKNAKELDKLLEEQENKSTFPLF